MRDLPLWVLGPEILEHIIVSVVFCLFGLITFLFLIIHLFFFLTALGSLADLRSLTRVRTQGPCSESVVS